DQPYVLWLPSWYPSKLEPFNGDFIKRHAEALSLYNEVCVLYIVRDKKTSITKNILKEKFASGPLKETIIYYHSLSTGIPFIDKFFSARKYSKIFRAVIKDSIEKKGKPSIVHVHVGMKAGLVAQWVKKKHGVPYVVTEHWSGFLKEADKKFQDLPIYFRKLWKKVLKEADGVSVVSKYLSTAISDLFNLSSCKVIPNVINRRIFHPGDISANGRKQYIHISGLAPLKNPKSILKAFSNVINVFPETRLEIFGSRDDGFLKLVNE